MSFRLALGPVLAGPVAALALSGAAPAQAAAPMGFPSAPSPIVRVVVTEKADPNAPKVVVPREQGKIGVGETKAFGGGKLNVTVSEIAPHGVSATVNGGQSVKINGSVPERLLVEDLACDLRYLGPSGAKAILAASCATATDADRQAINAAPKEAVAAKKPAEAADGAPEGTLKNPYTGDAAAIDDGRTLFLNYSCNGCHGGGGGGGMCPPLTNDTFVYGSSDDILYRLITHGSEGLLTTGHPRKGRENVVGPMPAFGELIETDQDIWKIIAYIRSIYKGDTTKKDW